MPLTSALGTMTPRLSRAEVISCLMCFLCVGCSYDLAQDIEGTLIANGSPRSGVRVALARGTSEQECAQTHLVGATDSKGQFHLTRQVHVSRINVIVQHDL